MVHISTQIMKEINSADGRFNESMCIHGVNTRLPLDLDCENIPGGGRYAIPNQQTIDQIIQNSSSAFEALIKDTNDNDLSVDSDGDGVPDDRDQCPNTPAGVAVNADGCPLDTDGDGVPDYKDECPGTPAGVEVNASGCPLDSDGDGVPDYMDQCPDTPAGADVNALGCEADIVLRDVNFEFDSATLTSQAEMILDDVASKLAANENVRVRLEGYTDSIGSEAYNKDLSQRRAQSVKDYLISQGISANRMRAIGYGEEQPIATNETAAGRAENRRVELGEWTQ